MRTSDSGKTRRAAVAAVVLLLGLCLLPATGRPRHANPNELIRIEHALAMAHWASHDLGPAAEVYGVSEDAAFKDGRLLSDKAPGLALLAVPVLWVVEPTLPRLPSGDLPAYWPLRHLLTVILAAVPAALAVWLVAMAARPRADLAAALALGTPLVTYGTLLFGHALAAMLVAAAWMPVLDRWRRGEALSSRITGVSGFAAAFAVGVEYPTAVLALVLAAAVVVDRRTPAAARAWFCGGAGLGLLPALLVHHFAFGAFWRTGYGFKAARDFAAIHSDGLTGVTWPSVYRLWGVLASPERGVLWYSPVLALAAVGLWLGIARRQRGAVPLALSLALYVAFAAGFVDWRAGWGAAARHLTPIVPLLLLSTTDAASRLTHSTLGTVVTVALAVMATVNTLLTVVLTPFFPVEFDAPLSQLVLPSLATGHAAPTMLCDGPGWGRVLVWSVALLASLWVVVSAVARGTARWRLVMIVATASLLVHAGLLVHATASRPPDLEPTRRWLLTYLGIPGPAAE